MVIGSSIVIRRSRRADVVFEHFRHQAVHGASRGRDEAQDHSALSLIAQRARYCLQSSSDAGDSLHLSRVALADGHGVYLRTMNNLVIEDELKSAAYLQLGLAGT